MRKLLRTGSACVAIALAAFGLTACLPATSGQPGVQVTPALFPKFDRAVTDYVNRCDPAKRSNVLVTAVQGDTVSVNGSAPRSGTFGVNITQAVGKTFTIAVTSNGVTTTHFVRCLPGDFPEWTVEKPGRPQATHYLVRHGLDFSVIFDTNGVPVWWLDRTPTGFSTGLIRVLPNGNLASVSPAGMEEYALDGTLVRTVATVGTTDIHDVLLLSDGNYVLATAENTSCDLSSWDASFTEPKTCLNHVFQVLTSAGELVSSWDTSANIPVTEVPQAWRDQQLSVTRSVYDPWHYNSIEFTGDAFIMSFRHLDAIYAVDQLTETGSVVWKLGGTARAESLTLVDDDLGGVSGQHDARWHSDGTMTLHDNGTNGLGPSRQPRVVRYAIDTGAGTATLVAEVRDAGITSSFCCGSTRLLDGGNWVTGWGGTREVTENTADGTRVFRLSVGTTVYRGIPLAPGELTVEELRAGMDAQYAG